MSNAQDSTSKNAAPKSGISLSDMTREFKAKEEGDASARRALNALSVTSSLVSALIEHPGPSSDNISMVEAARTMLRCADQTSGDLVSLLGLGSVGWAKHRVMRLVSSAVANRWSSTARSGNPSADVSAFVPLWEEMARHDLPQLHFESPAEEPAAALRIAMLDAMQPVMQEIAIFDMFHDAKEVATHARDTILVSAQRALAVFASEPMSDRSRSLLMQTLLRNGGAVYASAWRRHAEDTIDDLQKMDRAAQTAVVEANPGGLSLDPVDVAFDNSFSKLVEMVRYLAAPKAPTPEREHDAHPSEYDEEAGPASVPPVNSGAV